jgi:hypothetical protein
VAVGPLDADGVVADELDAKRLDVLRDRGGNHTPLARDPTDGVHDVM